MGIPNQCLKIIPSGAFMAGSMQGTHNGVDSGLVSLHHYHHRECEEADIQEDEEFEEEHDAPLSTPTVTTIVVYVG